MESQQKFMVCNVCCTFNHHAYIEDAMKGFCMQKTDFPFVCIIIDDASTDGEQDVINKYFEANFNLIETEESKDYVFNYGRHKTNRNCYFVALYLKYNHYSIEKDKHQYYSHWEENTKYIAFCEGDDYWIDENKLQKQVDFLEVNKDYSAYYSNVIGIDASGAELDYVYKLYPLFRTHHILKTSSLYFGLLGQTATCMIRTELIQHYAYCRWYVANGDMIVTAIARAKGNVFFSDEQMVKHRKTFTGDSWTAKTFGKDLSIWSYKSHLDLFDYSETFLEKYYIDKKMFLSSIILFKLKKIVFSCRKQDLKDLIELLSLCEFKLELFFWFMKVISCKYSISTNREKCMVEYNSVNQYIMCGGHINIFLCA